MDEAIDVVGRFGTARVHTLGATVTSWIPHEGREVLWCSPLASFSAGRAIRGGIPVCWPWFADQRPSGAARAPSHGLVRTALWRVERVEDVDGDGHARLSLEHPGLPEGVGVPPFRLTLSVRVGRELTLKLTHENLGTTEAIGTGALHAYLAADAANAVLVGAGGASALDKRTGQTVTVAERWPLVGPIDAVVHHGGPVTMEDGHRRVQVQGRHATDVVVWNPGVERPGDVPVGGEAGFVCVETGVVSDPWRVAPGSRRMLGMRLRVL